MNELDHYKNDKSTVFSIVPYKISEFKPGLYPGQFDIPACPNDAVPNVLSVGASLHMMARADSLRPTPMYTPSFVVADSIVNDFLNGQLWTSPDARPGICFVQGDISLVTFLKDHGVAYKQMKALQLNWFVAICKLTDTEWKKSQNSRVVSDQARHAAKFLGMQPDWLNVEVAGFESQRCPACGSTNPKTNAVCTICRCILDEAKFKTLKFASV